MTDTADDRPPFAVGHVLHRVADVAASAEYYLALGLRRIAVNEQVGIVELRGGTHIIFLPAEQPIAEGAAASFDLMADDVQAAHARCTELGLSPTPLELSDFHERFTLRDPSGYAVTVNSTHASGQPI